ncbi:MAG: response regulator [Candidatus Kaelpia aquatica]|nr:response regulator [Candidatus Kaelpia aquatica]
MKVPKGRILLADDDRGLLDSISDFLSLEDFDVETVNEGQKALSAIKDGNFDLVITDIKMPGLSGLEVLKKAREIDPELPIMIMTGFASLETAIEAVRDGAYEYMTKPFDMEKFLNVVTRAVKQRKLATENKELLNNLVDLDRQLESRLNQIFALGEVTKVITNISDLDIALEAVVNMSSEITGAKNIALLLLDDSTSEMVVQMFKGFDEKALSRLRIKSGEGVFGLVAQKRIPLRKSDLKVENIVLNKKELDILNDGDFICLPINYRESIFGILVLSNFAPEHLVSDDEIRILSILSHQASIVINNSLLYQRLQSKYLGTLEVLVAALEAKCKNTRGHSQRVSFYARDFAKFLGLPQKEIMVLEKACSIHDIGKIVIPENILAKPDKLTEVEMNHMKMHPAKGVDILIPLGIMKEMIPVVKYHHEKYNGNGYPSALRSLEIPFEARLVSIVDAFDAMTSLRSYRGRIFSKSEALNEIEINLSTQFDPELGHKFLKFSPDTLDCCNY